MMYILGLLISIFVGFMIMNFFLNNKTSKDKKDEKLNKKAKKILKINNMNSYNPKTNKWLEELLIKGIVSGIKKFNCQYGYGRVVFNNGTVYKFWNNNKYYAWLNNGTITYHNEKTNENIELEYSDEQPSPYIMLRFENLLSEFSSVDKLPNNVSVKKTKLK